MSKNRGTPKSSILIGFSIINHPFWGTPIFGNTHICIYNNFGNLFLLKEKNWGIKFQEFFIHIAVVCVSPFQLLLGFNPPQRCLSVGCLLACLGGC